MTDERTAPRGPNSRGRAVVITPAKPDGLGDQAMIDVAATQLSDAGFSVTLLPNPTPTRLGVPGVAAGGVGGKLSILANVARARRVIVIGADILDGRYNPDTILSRLKLAAIAHRFGAKVRVIGCSFSTAPNPRVIEWLKRAEWLEILAREEVSKARMEAALGRPVELVADSAFLLRPEATTPAAHDAIAFAEAQHAAGRRVLGLNASGLVFSKVAPGTLEAYAEAVAEWVAGREDMAAMVVSHDSRPGQIGDQASCDVLAEAVGRMVPDRFHYVRDGINAWDVKGFAGHLDMVLLCRMHFGIACLGNGVPPLALVSMGKFEGLMGLFGLDGLEIDPERVAADPRSIQGRLDDLAERAPDLRTRIEAALPEVRAMSARNYAGL
ncbi:polysaccharide pyruvyl transferase family protein [Jannaschia sp. LMIT008]|uniref:polysaccharide pyruvyl transferase family protein n=1 Tax=Jannaschia maritima TaxID=3032585 RepID=UPI00281243E3|nr:polysaccharide pyruvyl transferase family protein [Jannaschia sp. LMIT008]